ncbi:MAG TPA: LysR substrate-binding domain-containing protein [Kofleriaceae bacterium]|nr:LysR substrate-binding domain-containing protein [Kofleriaceae bacterium]
MRGIDDLRNVDLNLLVALEALLSTRSVTAAARRLRVGQPAMSHALGRLRALFGDPLLVRAGRGLEPTPRAEAIAAPLGRLLRDASELLRVEESFEPARSRRAFRLVCPDLALPALPDVLAALAAAAPLVRLDVRQPNAGTLEALAAGGDDLALAAAAGLADAPGYVQRTLGTVDWALFLRARHPLALAHKKKLPLAGWLAHPHVVVRTGSSSPSMVERIIAAAGHARHVALVAPGFLAAAQVVARTDFVLAAPRQLLAPVAADLGLAVRTPPLALPSVPAVAVWPERLHLDPGHRWFRGMVADVLTRVLVR